MTRRFQRIVINPKICQGQPIIRGMRITVAFVLKLMASGMSYDEILQAYPELERADLSETIEYAAWLAAEQYHSMPVLSEEVS